jgi:hypothetical protein
MSYLGKVTISKRMMRTQNLKKTNQNIRSKISVSVEGEHETTVYWDLAPCSLVVDRRFRDEYNLHYQGLIVLTMQAVRKSETSVYFYETIRR